MNESIKSIIMRRDGLSESEADDLIQEAHEAFHSYMQFGDSEAAYNICEEFFGLEPDYLDEFLF